MLRANRGRGTALTLAAAALLLASCGREPVAEPAGGAGRPPTPALTSPVASLRPGAADTTGDPSTSSPAIEATAMPSASPVPTPTPMPASPWPTLAPTWATPAPTRLPSPPPIPTLDLASLEQLIDEITDALVNDASAPIEEGRP